jgi:hypothetical protein
VQVPDFVDTTILRSWAGGARAKGLLAAAGSTGPLHRLGAAAEGERASLLAGPAAPTPQARGAKSGPGR